MAHGSAAKIGDDVPRLGGSWVRVSPAVSGMHSYPAHLELHEATSTSGRYVGRRGPSETAMLLWDAGTWEWYPPHQFRMSTSTDALETYEIEVRGAELSISADQMHVQYRRAATRRPGAFDKSMGVDDEPENV